MRISDADIAKSYNYGWGFAKASSPEHDFAIKNICSYVGPAMIYDQALNTNYYSIVVDDETMIEEIRETFSKIEFYEEDFVSCTKMHYYDQAQLVRKYEEAMTK